MKTKYGKFINGILDIDPKKVVVNNRVVFNPTETHLKEAKYKPLVDERPTTDAEHYAVAIRWEEEAERIVRVYEVREVVHTVDEYDQAMEDYLRDVRSERGYTTREPDMYINSAIPRWAQDAKDWIAFRDAVMQYALAVINEYASTGVAPKLEEFKAGFPVMEWTYTEGEG